MIFCFFVGMLGVEPRLQAPEACIMPLYDIPKHKFKVPNYSGHDSGQFWTRCGQSGQIGDDSGQFWTRFWTKVGS